MIRIHFMHITICRARRITPLSNKKTLDGIWFLILIVYVYTFDTCFILLECTASEVYSNDFTKTESHSLVSALDIINDNCMIHIIFVGLLL